MTRSAMRTRNVGRSFAAALGAQFGTRLSMHAVEYGGSVRIHTTLLQCGSLRPDQFQPSGGLNSMHNAHC